MTMGRHADKPWMRPPQYVDTRFPESSQPAKADETEDRSERDVDELIRRGPREERDRNYECTDTEPINYSNGPHDRPFDYDKTEKRAISSEDDEEGFEPLDPDEDEDEEENWDDE